MVVKSGNDDIGEVR